MLKILELETPAVTFEFFLPFFPEISDLSKLLGDEIATVEAEKIGAE